MNETTCPSLPHYILQPLERPSMSTEEGVKRKDKVSTLVMVGLIFEFNLLGTMDWGGGGGR